ncbi:aldo/keto reductase [Microlunatus speluncae]|uniref:aldo/keto reductase n=1 Tax=Microlunatus speluncae TaxID=2594267 RepID=UPI00126616BF|nr:aldo/keto reductase [Microlunatus speluncae]
MTTIITATRSLGRSGPQVSAIGVGSWALGGPYQANGRAAGWGEVDDDESIRALHAAFDAGITLIDTAPTYGIGHSESIIGRALATLPASAAELITVATKFGLVYDERRRTTGGTDTRPETIRAGCEDSLRRLGLDTIGLFQLHNGAESPAQAEDIVATCEELVAAGKINSFGNGQDDPEITAVFARSANCVAIQTQINVFGWAAASLDAARSAGLAILARSPLAMGMLTGKYTPSRRPAPGDVRLDTPYWDYFDSDAMPGWLERLDTVRELVTTDGRSLTQGALGYLLALDPAIIPLPGIRTEAQAIENAGALDHGPLPAAVATKITDLLADSPERR